MIAAGSSTRVVIMSVPYTDPLPMVAPVLLSACLTQAGVSAQGIDFSVDFLDHFVEKCYWPEIKNLLALGISPSTTIPRRAIIDIIKFIKYKLMFIKSTFNPEYIGLSIFTNESINFSYILIPYIRRYMPGVKIMLGGRGVELICGIENREHYKKYWDHGMADVIVVGDAESAIVDAINHNATGIYFAKPQTKEDIENIPIPNWDNYNFDLYKKFDDYVIVDTRQDQIADENPRYVIVTASKGCVRNCTFCDVASFWPKYIYRDGDKVANEIITNYKKTGIQNFRFSDNLINGSISHYRKMNLRIAEEIPNTIQYKGYAIFRSKSQMPAEDFELAKRAGCAGWIVGVESGSERIRYDMKKKFSNDDMDHGIVNLHKNGISQSHLLIVGYPTETDWDFEETENYLRRYAHLNSNGMIRIGVTPTFTLLHNSPLIQDSKYIQDYGLNFELSDKLSRFFWTTTANPGNTFDLRYNRWKRFVQLAFDDLKYVNHNGNVMQKKWYDELENLKKIYDEKKSKKVYPVFPIN